MKVYDLIFPVLGFFKFSVVCKLGVTFYFVFLKERINIVWIKK